MFKKDELDIILNLLYGSIERLEKELNVYNNFLNRVEKAEKLNLINQYKEIIYKIESVIVKIEDMRDSKVEAFNN